MVLHTLGHRPFSDACDETAPRELFGVAGGGGDVRSEFSVNWRRPVEMTFKTSSSKRRTWHLLVSEPGFRARGSGFPFPNVHSRKGVVFLFGLRKAARIVR